MLYSGLYDFHMTGKNINQCLWSPVFCMHHSAMSASLFPADQSDCVSKGKIRKSQGTWRDY